MSTLTYVNGVDWEAVYVDGELYYQNHSGRAWPNRILELLEDYNIEEVERVRANMATDDEGRLKATSFPNNLSEIYQSDDYSVK